MTRAQEPDDEIEYAVSGAPGAERTIVVLRTGPLATVDPGPAATRAHDVHVMRVHLEGPELDDPPAFGGETPAASTAAAIARIAERESAGLPLALVAERATCAIAITLAAEPTLRVEQLVLVAPILPEERVERDLAVPLLQRIRARALLVGARTEPGTVRAAEWYAGQFADGSIAVIPDEEIRSPDGRLGLGDAWPTVLAACAPPL